MVISCAVHCLTPSAPGVVVNFAQENSCALTAWLASANPSVRTRAVLRDKTAVSNLQIEATA